MHLPTTLAALTFLLPAALAAQPPRTIFWYKDPHWISDRTLDGINTCHTASRAAAAMEYQYLQPGDILQAYTSADCTGTPLNSVTVTEDTASQPQIYYNAPNDAHVIWSAKVKRKVAAPDTKFFWLDEKLGFVLDKTVKGVEGRCLVADRAVADIEWEFTRKGDRFRAWNSSDCSGPPEIDRVVEWDRAWVHINFQKNVMNSAMVNELGEEREL